MHGCGGMDATARNWAGIWSRFFNSLNIGTLTLDSFTTRAVKMTCGSPDAHWSRRRADDAYSGLDFLSKLTAVRKDQIYVLGRSNGGRTALNIVQDLYRSMRTDFFAGVISLIPTALLARTTIFMRRCWYSSHRSTTPIPLSTAGTCLQNSVI